MSRAIVWFRRDLRLDDNVALYEACARHDHVCAAFVVSPELLARPSMGAPLVASFFGALDALRASLRARGSDLALLRGDFADELLELARRVRADALYFNVDYEPTAIERDARVEEKFRAAGISVKSFTDHVYFGAEEILSPSGGAYRVYTPYKRRWFEMRAVAPRLPLPSAAAASARMLPREQIGETCAIPNPADFGFRLTHASPPRTEAAAKRRLERFLANAVQCYAEDRNIPSLEGTSYLSADLRAGTIGIRTCVEAASACARDASPKARENVITWVSELVWRDFYQMILKWHPRVMVESFQLSGDRVAWRDAEEEFAAWCDGRTGYPIVDAGMRQLNQTGWMHNRLRMIVASFLTKHLLIDWRRGALYFEQHLADADVAANNGGWQWAASTGTDAVPYFRIFSPSAQAKKIDPSGEFVRCWVPEVATLDYPHPIVEHEHARRRALEAFKEASRAI